MISVFYSFYCFIYLIYISVIYGLLNVPVFTIQEPPPKKLKTNKNEIIPTQIIPTNNSIKIDTITLASTSPTQFESINYMPSLESSNINSNTLAANTNTISVQPTPTTDSQKSI